MTRIVTFLALPFLLCSTVMAQLPSPESPGGLAIHEFKGPEASITGTTTIIDRNYGWLLKAAHVVKRCHCASLQDSVYVKPRYVLSGAGAGSEVGDWLECKILAK